VKKFVAVIAKTKAGKSTIIKSLTGCPSSNYRDFVEDKMTKRRIFVICGSPQEQDLSLDELKDILKMVDSDSNCTGIVMAIQPTEPTRRLSMEDIFGEVKAAGSFQINAFTIDPNWRDARLDTSVAPRLSALSVNSQKLDGRRFSIVNAAAINQATNIAT